MTLKELLQDITYTVAQGVLTQEVGSLFYDSRKAIEGGLFVCLVGYESDGHSWVEDAYKNGVRMFLCQRVPDYLLGRSDCTIVLSGDTRRALALVCARWFDFPAKQLKIVGVTGTKGKSTVVSLLGQVLESVGIPTGIIGTNGALFGGVRHELVNTTPESYELQKLFRLMLDSGMKAVAIEVSSLAVKMQRTLGIDFELGVFTNISTDHIGPGEHEDFNEYLACKSALFKQCKRAIVNIDDEHAAYILENAHCPAETFGILNSSDCHAERIILLQKPNLLGVGFDCVYQGKKLEIELGMPGTFNVYNALAVISAAQSFGVEDTALQSALKAARVEGRAEPVDALPFCSVIIDYAHNQISMESILKTLREYRSGRLVVLFGSVGGRSQIRRAPLGQTASDLADFCVLTSDNPNHEEPMKIINDILAGMHKVKYVTIPDRKEAIEYAIMNARDGDTILLAGKGHEKYQLICGERLPFDEREIVAQAAKKRLELWQNI